MLESELKELRRKRAYRLAIEQEQRERGTLLPGIDDKDLIRKRHFEHLDEDGWEGATDAAYDEALKPENVRRGS